MNNIVRKTKWFWAWQDNKEEDWLKQMSLQGLHLKQARLFTQYDFIQGQPQNYTYRLDFQDALKHQKKEEYLAFFLDTGWEYLGQMGGWQYFRKPTPPGQEPEIFTDPDSKIQKYGRYTAYMGMMAPLYLVAFSGLWGTMPDWFMWMITGVVLFTAAIIFITSIKIYQRIKQLKML